MQRTDPNKREAAPRPAQAAEWEPSSTTTRITDLVQQLRAELWAARPDPTAEEGAGPAAVPPIAPATLAALARRYTLPRAYQEFLTALGAAGLNIVPGPFQELVLHPASAVERAQIGFRGTRLGDDSFVAPHGWRRGWLVIATDEGDPYFLDTAKVQPDGECAVYTAMHGVGQWEPQLAASSIAQFLHILRVWVRIVVPHHDPENPEEPLDETYARRLASEIAQIDPAAVEHWII